MFSLFAHACLTVLLMGNRSGFLPAEMKHNGAGFELNARRTFHGWTCLMHWDGWISMHAEMHMATLMLNSDTRNKIHVEFFGGWGKRYSMYFQDDRPNN